jgi:hypothetical protein
VVTVGPMPGGEPSPKYTGTRKPSVVCFVSQPTTGHWLVLRATEIGRRHQRPFRLGGVVFAAGNEQEWPDQ